ncbi:uncharacterized protein LOC116847523 isoform X2 [Odontomachus brunneus]|uniref:uncharacterized protein LOC116847523 isoform X2 n=1 Tax=Odontomachus brunneus TaxID=486640 RepID=UPI0013F2448E|nr:uncharacterized protein LOC116847523 isoform X2 [Odontomachus brunneus]
MNLFSISTFNGPYTEDRYNEFFNPNICHVCKRPSKDLITCNQCYMISYCSEEHEAIHRNTHFQICKAIGRVITDKSFSDMYPSLGEWIKSRKVILHQMPSILSRGLPPYEMEMIMCAKSCGVCFRQTNIRCCSICYSANFCDDDQMLFEALHEKCCHELLLLLNMNIFHINGYTEQILLENKYKFTKFPDAKPCYDTITFISNYIFNNNNISAHRLNLDPSILVFYWTFQQHVNKTDIIYLEIWHIFLHYFKNTKELYIVLINPLKFEWSDLGFVCNSCSRYRQKVYVRSVSEPYHDFVRLDSYEKPNVIVLFEIELLYIETWSKSLEAIIAQECPLLLTAVLENTVQNVIDKIQEQTGTTRNRLHRENKFRGYMPHRNYTTGGFYYRNAHFIMYS